ncbi:MAG: pyridoxamine 5'-phosphate oxidase family protein [Candidatus Promineifilaceae bacterium]|nr:pyridoxamine 5'-phosphate oxidase family protein [Candidatus Promineifilaceae bacterium]
MNETAESAAAVRERALAYLQAHRVVTLATNGPHGLWAAAVFYATQQFELLFLSAGHTRHARNLAVEPQVAGTIQEDYRDWPEIKGIQLEGRVDRLDGRARRAAIDRYHQKYPFLAQAPPVVQQALEKVNWYRLTPSRLYYIDNSRGFGHRDEIDLSAPLRRP